jgi:dihydroorotate dehydrogenase (NAD+) catalytic subunit
MVWEVAKRVSIPIIGIGGIMTSRDALEFLIAGASAVQIGTAHFVNPRIIEDVLGGIEDYLQRHGFLKVGDLTGSLENRSSGYYC